MALAAITGALRGHDDIAELTQQHFSGARSRRASGRALVGAAGGPGWPANFRQMGRRMFEIVDEQRGDGQAPRLLGL